MPSTTPNLIHAIKEQPSCRYFSCIIVVVAVIGDLIVHAPLPNHNLHSSSNYPVSLFWHQSTQANPTHLIKSWVLAFFNLDLSTHMDFTTCIRITDTIIAIKIVKIVIVVVRGGFLCV